MKKMQILDTTIRDGSYAVDFKFSCDDVTEIAARLEKLGLGFIEIGHGQGLHASSAEHGISLQSDMEYMEAARRVLKKSKFGFFCIPGIARVQDLQTAREHGVSFIRIGIHADQFRSAEPYIIKAKKLGFLVMVNFMKSYTVSPAQFAKHAKAAEELGADYIYIVDSAGCMMPKEIGMYYEEVKQKTNMRIGFHGHNNLGLAVSNSLYCVQKGFDLIDCSLQGIGRSLGNASTEMVVMALEKSGYSLGIDIPCLLEYGYLLLRDIVKGNLYNPLELICGYAGFHSGFLKEIYKCCEEKKVDPLRLIIAYSEKDQSGMDYEQLCKVAENLPQDLEKHPYNFRKFFSSAYNDR